MESNKNNGTTSINFVQILIAILIAVVPTAIVAVSTVIYQLGQQVARLESDMEDLKLQVKSFTEKANKTPGDNLRPIAKQSRWVITTSLTKENDPKDSVDIVSMSKGEIIFYTTWYGLKPNKNYQVIWSLQDGTGSPVGSSAYDFKPKNATHYTWYYYRFNPKLDKPGNWKITANLDGVESIDKTFFVSQN